MTLNGDSAIPARGTWNVRGALALFFALVAGISIDARAQAPVEQQTFKQIPAPLPKIAVINSAAGSGARGQYHKVDLSITNWDRYPGEMFVLPSGQKLPPNPCANVRSRIVIAVYSDRGSLLSNCIAISHSTDLGKFTVLIAKGKPLPDFLYAVINDRLTGAAYRSNLLSPQTGQTK